jgi:predicted pyridoxine 5'-phosphate oxidase superfamily flavin-nucleotide-binding protein
VCSSDLVEVVSSGPDYEKAKAIAKAERETLPAKNLLRMTVTEVYSVAPGPDAGKRLL